jgi:hypothetical protein
VADFPAGVAVQHRIPNPLRLIVAAVLAVVVAGLVDAALAAIGVSLLSVPADFHQFQPSAYLTLTVPGVIAATIVWVIVAAKAKNPTALLRRLAIIVVPVTWVADVALLVTGQSPLGVVVLMVMHAGVGVITYLSLTRIAPARLAPQPA